MTELPETMRAAVLVRTGGPECLELRGAVPVPVPGPADVLIRVRACGVNNTDINTRVGWYSKSVTGATSDDGSIKPTDDGTWGGSGLSFPRIQGADPSGTVVAVGSEVTDALIGRRVLVDPWIRDVADPSRRDLAGYLGSEFDGGFAEYCSIPAANAHPHDSRLTDVELASIPCSWSTAAHMLSRVDLREGQSIAITGASGGVGSALVSLAKLRGAVVTAIAGPSKLEAVATLGADHLVSRAEVDVAGAAMAANGGAFNVVADVVGGPATPSWFESLHRGGRYVTSGAIAGPIVDLDLRTLYLNDLEFYGATVYEPSVFAALVGYLDRDEIKPVVAATYPLSEIHAAQSAFGRKEHVGAIVVTI